MQCVELFNFLSKDVVGARSLQGLGRLDEHLEKKKNRTLGLLPHCQNESVWRYTKTKITEG